MASTSTRASRADTSWRDGGRVGLVVRSAIDRFRTSLFGVPALWILGALVLSQVATGIDRRLDGDDLPAFLDTTVDSARAILGAISSGTIAAASVVFSLTLVAIQMSSSVYSSRVLRSFLRDRFQQHMIGIVLGTFFYSLLVLREVRGPLEESGDPYIPSISVFIAVVLALAAVLALLASISHTAQSLRVSQVTSTLVDEVVALVARRFPDDRSEDVVADRPAEIGVQGVGVAPATPRRLDMAASQALPVPSGPGAVVTASQNGWLQQISVEAIRDGLDNASTVRLEVVVGSYVAEGSQLATVWPAPSAETAEGAQSAIRGAFGIGSERTLQQDVAFGLVMLEDVAVKALSPGVNDPNTAQAVVVQIGEVLLAILSRDLSPGDVDVDGCRLLRPAEPTYSDYVFAGLDQIRHYADGQPAVQLTIVRTLVWAGDELIRRRASTDESLDALRSMLRYTERDLAPATADRSAAEARTLLDATDWYEGDWHEDDR